MQRSSLDNSINAGHYVADWVAEVLGGKTVCPSSACRRPSLVRPEPRMDDGWVQRPSAAANRPGSIPPALRTNPAHSALPRGALDAVASGQYETMRFSTMHLCALALSAQRYIGKPQVPQNDR